MMRRPTLYNRQEGPVGWEAMVFPATDQSGHSLVRLLLESGLEWWWESTRSHPEQVGSDPSLPETRPLTRLHSGSAEALLRDLAETDEDEYRRVLTLVATAAGSPAPGPGLRAPLAAFCQREVGPVRAVVLQVGDSSTEHVFVPHQPVPAGQTLLGLWGLDAAEARV